MARITYVKKAQQKYATTPVLNEDGSVKKTPVMKKDGSQKVTKTGRAVFMAVTVQDKTRPLPLEVCDYCSQPIELGTPYKHVTPKTSTYGSQKKSRHQACPTWRSWDLSNSLSAQIDREVSSYEDGIDSCSEVSEVQDLLDSLAEGVRGLAEEKREAASNIEDGFGHPTSSSEELEEIAQQLEDWADELSGADIPELPEIEETECDYCGGTGKLEETVEGNEDTDPEEECTQCGGEGMVLAEELGEDQLADWRDEVRDNISIDSPL